MTITQIECFIEAARTGSFSKAGVNLFISQATISRQIKALEDDLGFPLFERRNVGVRLTEMGSMLFSVWEELLITHRTAVDKARDFYTGSQKRIRIGVQNFGKLGEKIREALFYFAQMSKGLEVEYESLPSHKLLQGVESGEFHVIIAHRSELIKHPDLKVLDIEKLSLETGIVVSKYHRLALRKNATVKDLKGETFAIMGGGLSVDYKDRIVALLKKEGVLTELSLREYQSWSKLEFDLLTGKCVSVLYGSHLIGLEDKLAFFPISVLEQDAEKVSIAWKDDKYMVKAKNIVDMF